MRLRKTKLRKRGRWGSDSIFSQAVQLHTRLETMNIITTQNYTYSKDINWWYSFCVWEQMSCKCNAQSTLFIKMAKCLIAWEGGVITQVRVIVTSALWTEWWLYGVISCIKLVVEPILLNILYHRTTWSNTTVISCVGSGRPETEGWFGGEWGAGGLFNLL